MECNGREQKKEEGLVMLVTFGHSCDITPLLMSLALSKGFDVCTTESMVVVEMVIAYLTDPSSFAPVMGDFAIDFIMPP